MKKVIYFLFLFVFLLTLPLSASAKYYTNEIPSYAKISGGAFFEIYDTNLGQITVVFPVEFENGCFAFKLSSAGTPVNILNVTNSTVYGYIYTSSGSTYSCRASRQDIIEYYVQGSGYSSSYVDLNPNMSTLVNTNIQFLTNSRDWYNESILDSDKYINVILLFLLIVECISLFILALRKGR